MGIKLGIANMALGLLSALGDILFFLGFLVFAGSKNIVLMLIGLVLVLLTEAAWIYLVKYEDRKKLDTMRTDFMKIVGSNFALPVLLLIFYFLSPAKYTAGILLVLSIIAAIKSISLIIKVYMVDKVILN